MIDLEAARRLLNMGARMGEGPRAEEQLRGAVALHNMLEREGIAYLADEVGMGKTYVALGAVALFRHFRPNFRVLVIAPRGNIQSKWGKELRNFVGNNVRFSDLRVKGLDGRPARGIVECESLLDLVEESLLDPHRDFLARMTSFSLAVPGQGAASEEGTRRLRERLQKCLPWLPQDAFSLKNKQAFKDNVARAVCCALPRFDLVIVDEAHTLKHGYSDHAAARNRVMALALGRDTDADVRTFRGYGPRADRVLFLSATPVEDSYGQLWNQLDVFGRGQAHASLRGDEEDEAKKEHAKRFLIRRVTSLPIAGGHLTKNLYRRDWRRGGVHVHDEPIRTDDPRQKLVVALVQKKVSEVLNDPRFNASFQIGMLASFESFLETAQVTKNDEDEGATFDLTEQTDDEAEREGVDVRSVNGLATRYRRKFGRELPHPKMDALVDRLSAGFRTGEKALVFVRRVASVKELKRKLDEKYDEWLFAKMSRELPEEARSELTTLAGEYRKARAAALARNRDLVEQKAPETEDGGGIDTFFAWFFRGEPQQQTLSGASVQKRVDVSGFFEENVVASLLDVAPGQVLTALAHVVGGPPEAVAAIVDARARAYLTKSPKRADRIHAAQAAAIELLAERESEYRDAARILMHQRYDRTRASHRTDHDATDSAQYLEARTFFTELRLHPELEKALWPTPGERVLEDQLRERGIRALLLGAAVRLGHSLIDLYVVYANDVGRITGANLRGERDQDGEDQVTRCIHAFLARLERQRITPLAEREWAAFDELAELAANYRLILDTNAPSLEDVHAATAPSRELAVLLGRQQPVGGMSGQVSRTSVRQFRMPGYPFVLISTELLQEGEDLHTFCSHVHHYGITSTPSAVEQRIGRIDRVQSQTDRRLSALQRPPLPEELIQVYFPHLEDTVEVLQVQRVLHRMNRFLELMHVGLTTKVDEAPRIDTKQEFARARREVPRITSLLETAFPVASKWLTGEVRDLAVDQEHGEAIRKRFQALKAPLSGVVTWDDHAPTGCLLGTIHHDGRRQPFLLHLRSTGEHALVRCVSPVGRVATTDKAALLATMLVTDPVRVGVTETAKTYDLTAEDDVLIGSDARVDVARVGLLIGRVTKGADRLEKVLLELDEPLDSFRPDLAGEGAPHGN